MVSNVVRWPIWGGYPCTEILNGYFRAQKYYIHCAKKKQFGLYFRFKRNLFFPLETLSEMRTPHISQGSV